MSELNSRLKRKNQQYVTHTIKEGNESHLNQEIRYGCT